MSSRLEKLLFRVSLIDKASGPAGKIAQRMDELNNRATQGYARVGVGAAGLYAAGYALNSILSPSIAMDRALGELESLGVADKALKQLEKTSLRFTMRYGGNATDIVRSSYDIQSAIAGLTGGELASFTSASGLLAKATKSDASTITDYMGTMYGIFQTQADAMGKAKWVEMLTGQTASAVQMFKTTGSEMASSFASLGAEATSGGIAMSEQIAILGTLQATMSGSEAGTKYKSFLAGIGKAQDTLGLAFTDSQGRMLPMVDILQKIQGKFGAIDTVAESDLLQKAFGRKESVGLIKLLSQNLDGLHGNINALGNVTGMDKAMAMADAMVDPWERMAAVGTAVKIVFGRVMQPAIEPVLDSLIRGGETIVYWTDKLPNLTRVVGIGVLSILGIVAAVSAFTLVSGVASLVMAGWTGIMLLGTGVMKLWRLGLAVSRAVLFLFQISAYAGSLAVKALGLGFLSSLPAIWAFSAALLANPMTWVVLGVVGLIGALVAMAYHWDLVTASVGGFVTGAIDWLTQKWGMLRGTIENNAFLKFAFTPLLAGIDLVNMVINSFGKITTWWQQFKTWLGGLNPFDVVGDGINGLIAKINLIPGINLGDGEMPIAEKVQRDRDAINQVGVGTGSSRASAVPAGGLLQQITNATQNNDNGSKVHIEHLEVKPEGQVDGHGLYDELLMIS